MSNETTAGSSLTGKAADLAYKAFDTGLGTVSYVAEKVDHTLSSRLDDSSTEYDSTDRKYHSRISRTVEEFRSQVKRGLPFSTSVESLSAVIDSISNHKEIDDRLMLLEHMLVLLSRLPVGSRLSQRLTDRAIGVFWHDLPHPPASVVGKAHRYRSADGSGYNLWIPDMGKAGTPYGRSVPQVHPLPPNQLPSPELIFDALLKREKQVDHPAGLSSTFFAFANLVIHMIFHTDFESSEGINKTSSYLDFSIIYGNNLEEQKEIRAYDGMGHIWPDTFADHRLLRMAPSTPALLIVFCRYHNYVADRLLQINERGTFNADLTQLTDEQKEAQDEDLFQITRLIMCGLFMTVILSDYLSSILGLVREGSTWSLNPLEMIRADDHSIVPRGVGNVSSVEFSAMYTWHSTISTADEQWTEGIFKHIFPEKQSWDDISIEDWKGKMKVMREMMRTGSKPPKEWTFGGLKRGPDGKFADADLARILQDATFNPAGAYGARRVPHSMKIIEMLSIQQNRDWGTCSMNEFRKFLGYKPFASFEEWNPDPSVAEAARRLYHHPDNLELYVGLVAEAAKTPVPGAGLCPGYTISRSILADAVALVRGDRFMTTDMTAHNLTAWGIHECSRDPHSSGFGGMLGKLLMRALPDHYTPNSVYTNFSMMTPSAMNKYLSVLGIAEKFDFERPTQRSPIKPITAYAEAKAALENPRFKTTYVDNANLVFPGKGYFSSLNELGRHSLDRRLIFDAFAGTPSDVVQHIHFFEKTIEQLIKTKSYTLVGGSKRSINIVRDVLHFVPIHFVASHIAGLPLKTDSNPTGFYFEQELFAMLRGIYDFVFLDNKDPSTKVTRQDEVAKNLTELTRQIDRHLRATSGSVIQLAGIVDSVINMVNGKTYSPYGWLRRLHASGKSTAELANHVLALAVVVSVEYSQTLTNVVDVLLHPDYKTTAATYAHSHDPRQLKALISEAIRIAVPLGGVYREVITDVTLSTGTTYSRGDRVFVSLKDANRDASVFENPETVNSSRPVGSVLHGDGIVKLLGESWLLDTMTPVIKAIFSLKYLDRAPGNSGKLISFQHDLHGTSQKAYFDEKQFPTPWASDMTLTFEE